MKFLLLMLFPVLASAQIQPYIQAGVTGSVGMGYQHPSLSMRSGVEFDSRLTSLSEFEYQPWTEKAGVVGSAYTVKVRSKNYYQISRHVSLGAGANYVRLATSAYTKSDVSIIGGGMLPFGWGRLFADYSQSIRGQNNSKTAVATMELGRGRIRPVLAYGVDHYTEPSYCGSNCAGHLGVIYEAGIKIMVGRTRTK